MIKTIAVDFDGVIHDYRDGWRDGSIYGDFTPNAMAALMTLLAHYPTFVHTARSPRQVAHWIEHKSGHHIECTLQMRPPIPAWWRWGRPFRFWNTTGLLLVTDRKLPAAVYIDDRGLRFNNWNDTIGALAELDLNVTWPSPTGET